MTKQSQAIAFFVILMTFGFGQAVHHAYAKQYTPDTCHRKAEDTGYNFSLYIAAYDKCFISEDGDSYYDLDAPKDQINKPAFVMGSQGGTTDAEDKTEE